jgi:hypothetical protein
MKKERRCGRSFHLQSLPPQCIWPGAFEGVLGFDGDDAPGGEGVPGAAPMMAAKAVATIKFLVLHLMSCCLCGKQTLASSVPAAISEEALQGLGSRKHWMPYL